MKFLKNYLKENALLPKVKNFDNTAYAVSKFDYGIDKIFHEALTTESVPVWLFETGTDSNYGIDYERNYYIMRKNRTVFLMMYEFYFHNQEKCKITCLAWEKF